MDRIKSMDNEKVFVCIHCGMENRSLIRRFRKGLFNLSKCVNCSKVVDDYIEFDFVLILLDLILQKKKVFRHLIFNRSSLERKFLLGLIFILSETCLRWVLVKDRMPFDIFYLYVLFAVSGIEYATYIGMMVFFIHFYSSTLLKPVNLKKLSEVLLISSYGKLFCLAATIWCEQDIITSMLLSRLFVFITSFLALNVFTRYGRIRVFWFLMCSTISSNFIGWFAT